MVQLFESQSVGLGSGSALRVLRSGPSWSLALHEESAEVSLSLLLCPSCPKINKYIFFVNLSTKLMKGSVLELFYIQSQPTLSDAN